MRLWDVVTLPERVEYIIREQDGKSPNGGTDCDDSSMYICWAVDAMMRNGYVKSFTEGPWMMSVVYAEGNKLRGHNVCVWGYTELGTKEPKYAHMSNWNSHRPINGFDSIEAIAEAITGEHTPVGVARCDKHLDSVDYKVK
jgi:hypothetical protein